MILYLIFLIAGILMFFFSLLRLRGIAAYVRQCERATGRVVRQEEIKDSDGLYYLPIFEFTTRNEETMEYRHGISSSSSRDWPVGATQTFLYYPEDPTSARFLGYGIFKPTIMLMGVALAFVAIGAGYFLLQGFLS